MSTIIDVQGQDDHRSVDISKVGIKGVAFRGKVLYGRDSLPMQGTIDCYVYLPSDKKGTHMSRMTRGITKMIDKELNYGFAKEIVTEMSRNLNANKIYLEISTIVIRQKKSPVTEFTGYESIKVNFSISLIENTFNFKSCIEVIGTSLCPASKVNSKYGAHNQRATVRVSFNIEQETDIQRYVEVSEAVLSSPVYPIIKLEDEAFITEKAYENPKFVEDIIRDLAVELKVNGLAFEFIDCENHESIHTHNAYAYIEAK